MIKQRKQVLSKAVHENMRLLSIKNKYKQVIVCIYILDKLINYLRIWIRL